MYRKQIIITGGNAGIGFETAKALAQQGHRLTLLVRDEVKGQMAVERIKEMTGDPFVEWVAADLSSFSSIFSACEVIHQRCDEIDVLIHNAGTFQSSRVMNQNGIETTFMVNHLAIFYMTHLLLPLLSRSSESRIICVNSDSHFQATFDLDNLQLEKRYHGLRAYARSKLANILFTYEFYRRNPMDHVSVYALQPGLVNTDIGAKHASFLHRLIWNIRSHIGKTPEEGADSSVYLTTEDRRNLKSGKYWDNRKVKKSSRESYDSDNAYKLWEKSLELCGIEDYFSLEWTGEKTSALWWPYQ